MFYHLILTDECNLCCTYCRGKAFEVLAGGETDVAIDESLPPDFSCELGDLYRFLGRDPDPCITFYGGEPLMRMDLIRTIMDTAPVQRFMIQTNANIRKSTTIIAGKTMPTGPLVNTARPNQPADTR